MNKVGKIHSQEVSIGVDGGGVGTHGYSVESTIHMGSATVQMCYSLPLLFEWQVGQMDFSKVW
jgi:hypothetical protein